MTITFGVCAPSGRVDPAKIEAGKNWLVAQGCGVKLHPQTFTHSATQEAGSAETRAQALVDLFLDPEITAILSARGGNKAMEILPLLPYEIIKQNPKPIVGFSDSTALQLGVLAQTGIPSLHAMALHSFANPDMAEADKLATLTHLATPALQTQLAAPTCLQTGSAKGMLVGGNLSLLAALVGTPYCPNLKGAILFFEEWREETSHMDRMLQSLKLRGVFDDIAGLAIGQVSEMLDTGNPFGHSVEEIILSKITHRKNLPVLFNLPFGHGNRLFPIPTGAMAEISGNSLAF